MKRILALVALAFLAFPFTAHASQRWLLKPHAFRDVRGTAVVDSFFNYSKVAQAADTTAPVAISELPLYHNPGGEAAAVDSTTWFGVYFGQAGTTAPAIDSLYVGMEVSIDGVNWTAVTPTILYIAAGTKPPVDSAILLEINSTNTMGRLFECASGTVGDMIQTLYGATKPTEKAIFGYNFVRWIVTWGDEAAQPVGVWYGHWEN